MRVKAVSALRSKRGLRRVNGAEPQVVGLTPQTTNDRRTDTMKTYILRSEDENGKRNFPPGIFLSIDRAGLMGVRRFI